MAEVFVAIAQGAQGFEKPVVIKRLLPELAQHQRFQQMFLDEARILLNLQHGNIVQILDMGRMDGLPFLALEYVDGKDLRSVLERARDNGTPMPHGLVAYVASEVCRALDYAHRKTDENGQPLHIVHRDVNPANIFLSHEGEVKIGDFGLAKARDNLEKSDAGIIKGKFNYLSPEQAGGEPLDHRSDIFSLGSTIYEMTCGYRPFAGETDLEIVMRVRETRFEPPSRVCQGFSPELEAIILRAMQPDPAERYATASHMQTDLGRFLQSLPAPPGDRELTNFLDMLFGSERRSQSHLFRLAPVSSLPPPVTSVTTAGGVSEFRHSDTPVTPCPAIRFPAIPGATTPAPPTGSAAPLDPGTQASASMITQQMPYKPGQGRAAVGFAIAGVLVLAGAVAAAMLLLGRDQPRASLSIISIPAGASVYLDGEDTGRKTPAILDGLEVDRDYLVALRHAETADATHRFRFERSGRHAHRFDLAYEKSSLEVESVPPASDVLIDGELRGQTPLRLLLPRGKKVQITIQRKGYLTKVVHHYAEGPGSVLRIALEQETRTARRGSGRGTAGGGSRKMTAAGAAASGSEHGRKGMLEVATDLTAEVFLDNKLVGRTPGFRISLAPGSYFLVVRPEGTRIRHQAEISIQPGSTHRFTLTPPPE